jgi:hypothetical protein
MKLIGLWAWLLLLAVGWVIGSEDSVEPLAALTVEHFRIHTEPAAVEAAQETADDLQRLWSLYEETVGALVPLRETQRRLDVYSFTGPEPLDRFLAGSAREEIDAVFPGLPKSIAGGFLAVDSSGLLARTQPDALRGWRGRIVVGP